MTDTTTPRPTRTLDELLEASGRASEMVRQTQRELFALTPHTEAANATYVRLLGWETIEREARKMVRSHPDFSYEGL